MAAPDPRRRRPWRSPLGLWFCGLAALGLVRFGLQAFRHDGFRPDAASWIWLAGSVLLAAIGVAVLVRDARRPPR